jgi:hypothetical protein
MVVNFRARGISRGARKLARTPTLIYKKKKTERDETEHEPKQKKKQKQERKEEGKEIKDNRDQCF